MKSMGFSGLTVHVHKSEGVFSIAVKSDSDIQHVLHYNQPKFNNYSVMRMKYMFC